MRRRKEKTGWLSKKSTPKFSKDIQLAGQNVKADRDGNSERKFAIWESYFTLLDLLLQYIGDDFVMWGATPFKMEDNFRL